MGKSLVTGIDIGHHSIKAVVLKPVKGTFTLAGYKELPIEADIFSDNHMLNYQKIVKKLKALRKGLPLFSSRVALSVPDNTVISKVLQIDSELDDREREFAIFQNFSHQSPFPIEELHLDYIELPKKSVSQTTVSYQVYATKKDLVESRVNAAEKAGFQPFLMEMQAHSLTHVWQKVSQQENKSDWLLVDIGLSQTLMCIDFADKAPFHKELALGTQVIDAKGEYEHLMHSSTERFIFGLIEKLQRNIQILGSVHGTPIKGIWLTGGGAATPMLVEEIQRRLEVECEVLNPLHLFKGKRSKHTAEMENGFAFSTAVGLALRGIDWMEQSHAA
ncbi:type IV pilus assembly protein PilM [Vibrio sp. TRT 21S02]|uniref:type IV pilus assembly protein PilM n=1 Tax=unclassified Vibrio TaxID=2614977 RepID=UPI003CF69E35